MKPSSVSWPQPEWVRDAVFYQILPDRFEKGDPLTGPPQVVPWGDPLRAPISTEGICGAS